MLDRAKWLCVAIIITNTRVHCVGKIGGKQSNHLAYKLFLN